MFYKIIKNNTVIDIGSRFLYWQARNKILLGCEVETANYLLTDLEKIYETYWLQTPPEDALRYENVFAVEINEEDYNVLQKLLLQEETIPVFEPIIETQESPPEEEAQRPMTMANASTLLLELMDKYNELLTRNALLEECVLELSQELYK